MPDLGSILRKARDHAVLHGAAGANGATSKNPCPISAHVYQQAGPTAGIAMGPVGPATDGGPTGPGLISELGPGSIEDRNYVDQGFSGDGPSGPTGPSEKRHVHENDPPRAASALERDALPDTPQGWRDGLARLDRGGPSCPGFRSDEWNDLHRVIADFMDHHAGAAFALGWRAVDLFGVHQEAGAARVDSCGALMLPFRRTVAALSADTIAFGPLVYRRRSMPQAVVVWAFSPLKIQRDMP